MKKNKMDFQADYYIGLAEQAAKENAHVACTMYYRTAIELTHQSDMGSVMISLIRYADNLKKYNDKLAVYEWCTTILNEDSPFINLADRVKRQYATYKKKHEAFLRVMQNATS